MRARGVMMTIVAVGFISGSCGQEAAGPYEGEGERLMTHHGGIGGGGGTVWLDGVDLDWAASDSPEAPVVVIEGTLSAETLGQLDALRASFATNPPDNPPLGVFDAPCLLLYYGPGDKDFAETWPGSPIPGDLGLGDDERLVELSTLAGEMFDELLACDATKHFVTVDCG